MTSEQIRVAAEGFIAERMGEDGLHEFRRLLAVLYRMEEARKTIISQGTMSQATSAACGNDPSSHIVDAFKFFGAVYK